MSGCVTSIWYWEPSDEFVFDLINVINGMAKLPQALIRDKRLESLHLLPASQTRDKDALTEDGVAKVIEELRTKFDWIICDSPAGIERGATLAMRYADAAIIVTNPEVSSVRDSDRIIGLLNSKTAKAERGERVDKHVLITRYHSSRAARGEMLSINDVLEILSNSPFRHHSRKPGGVARFQCWIASDAQQPAERPRPRLLRCRATT